MVQVLKDHKPDNTFEGTLEELGPSELSYQMQKQASKHRIEDDSSITSGSHDESIILDGPDADHSRIPYSRMGGEKYQQIPMMPLRMEISSFGDKSITEVASRDASKAQKSQPKEREPKTKRIKMVAAKNKKAKSVESLEKKPIWILQNPKQNHEEPKEAKLEPPIQEHVIDILQEQIQVYKHVIDIGEDSLDLRCKSLWLDYVGAADCIKDKVSNCYLM